MQEQLVCDRVLVGVGAGPPNCTLSISICSDSGIREGFRLLTTTATCGAVPFCRDQIVDDLCAVLHNCGRWSEKGFITSGGECDIPRTRTRLDHGCSCSRSLSREQAQSTTTVQRVGGLLLSFRLEHLHPRRRCFHSTVRSTRCDPAGARASR